MGGKGKQRPICREAGAGGRLVSVIPGLLTGCSGAREGKAGKVRTPKPPSERRRHSQG